MSKEILFKMNKIKHPFTRENPVSLNRDSSIGQESTKSLFEFVELTNNPNFIEQIKRGNITLAAIKPQAHNSKLGMNSDVEAAMFLQTAISLDPILCPIFSISVNISREAAELFYPPSVKENMNNNNAWEKFMDYLSSGPTTYLILYDSTESGQAISRWREIIGATDPAQAKPGTIRGNYATSKQDNLVHGSSNPDEVEREIGWLKKLISNHLNIS